LALYIVCTIAARNSSIHYISPSVVQYNKHDAL
jgi:hypothetical protein